MWKFASTYNGENPDVVLASIGVAVTFETISAIAMLHEMVPELRVRMVNVTDLMVLGASGTHPHSMSDEDFNALFTPDRHVHFSYHSYPIELKGLLFGRPNMDRITIEGYREEGTTTTPLAVCQTLPFDPKFIAHAYQ
jgi:xylulose-5-phosphate/fructose-6-phosphate phosphoketolase